MRTGVEARHKKTQCPDLLEKFHIDFTELIYSYILCILSWGWGWGLKVRLHHIPMGCKAIRHCCTNVWGISACLKKLLCSVGSEVLMAVTTKVLSSGGVTPWCLINIYQFFDPENGRNRFLCKVGNDLSDCTASHHGVRFWGSHVGIAQLVWLQNAWQGFNSRQRQEIFLPVPQRTAFSGGKAVGAWSWPLISF
jgi:hypothetical protein